MKFSQKIALGLALTVAVASIFVLCTTKKSDRSKRMLSKIADEGYETAQDVLFPGKKIYGKGLKYGPVLPR